MKWMLVGLVVVASCWAVAVVGSYSDIAGTSMVLGHNAIGNTADLEYAGTSWHESWVASLEAVLVVVAEFLVSGKNSSQVSYFVQLWLTLTVSADQKEP